MLNMQSATYRYRGSQVLIGAVVVVAVMPLTISNISDTALSALKAACLTKWLFALSSTVDFKVLEVFVLAVGMTFVLVVLLDFKVLEVFVPAVGMMTFVLVVLVVD